MKSAFSYVWRSAFCYLWGLLTEAAKNVNKAPGWVPLAATCFLLVQFTQDDIALNGFSVHVHKEVVALAATAVLYVLGDSLDHVVFDDLTKRRPARLVNSRERAKRKLKLETQLYRVSLGLAVAAGRYKATLIQLKNETAKFARSLAVLTFAFLVVLLWHSQFLYGAAALLLTLALLGCYLWLKIIHMCNIYEFVANLEKGNVSYSVHDLPDGARMFFWNGELVSSGPLDRSPPTR